MSENDGYAIHACLLIVLENTVYLPNFVKMFLCNQEENKHSVYECVFLKVCNQNKLER